MGNVNCKRCFSKDKEIDSEIKLDSDLYKKDEFDLYMNSPKIANINETNPKEELNNYNSYLNNRYYSKGILKSHLFSYNNNHIHHLLLVNQYNIF